MENEMYLSVNLLIGDKEYNKNVLFTNKHKLNGGALKKYTLNRLYEFFSKLYIEDKPSEFNEETKESSENKFGEIYLSYKNVDCLDDTQTIYYIS